MPKSNTMKNVTAGVAVLACVLTLSACSSKPETSDIQKDLAEVYACPLLELSEVKKVDGADVNGKLYDVAFTYTISVKGGNDAAAKLFAESSFVASQLRPARMAYERAMAGVALGQGSESGAVSAEEGAQADTSVKEAADRIKQLENRLSALIPCDDSDATLRLAHMRSLANAAAKSGQEKVAVPIAIKMSGAGRMSKTESGWHFAQMPDVRGVEEVFSEPVVYPRFAPLDIPAN